MSRTVTSYRSAFKLRAVREVLREGARLTEVAQRLNVPYSTLIGWRALFLERGEAAFVGDRDPMLARLQSENERLKTQLQGLQRDTTQYEQLLGQMLLENLRLKTQTQRSPGDAPAGLNRAL